MPSNALSFEQALKQGPDSTLPYLKSQLPVAPFETLPPALKIERVTTNDKDKSLRMRHIRKFHTWSLQRKATRAAYLMEHFSCQEYHETQALGFSLERDFPEPQAMELAESMHLKVAPCQISNRDESILRLTVFSIYKNQCPKAMEHLKMLPTEGERGVADRAAYLRSLCSSSNVVEQKNPWGGYGIQLGNFKIEKTDKPVWFLAANSGQGEWDQLLSTLIDLTQKGDYHKVRYLMSMVNYDKFRTLPYPFQASVLVVMHFAGADLSVFQALHRYLSENPQLITKEVLGLLFPVRFWESIVKNTHGIDPVLVKSLIRQESAFDPTARSPARAFGLTQVIYPTARIFGMKNRKQLFDPEANIRVGSEFLKKLINDFGSVELALAAYNAGPLKVREWQKRYPTNNIDLFVEMIPYTETREYVRLVLRNYKIYKTVLFQPTNQADIAQLQ